MSNNKGSMVKRIIAAAMMFVMAFMLPAGPLRECSVQAAEVRSSGEHIKEFKLFIKKGGSADDARAWCEEQGDGWKVLGGDEEGNLNGGMSGAFTKEVGVFLCYKTTSDPDDAITDLAVMNEKGNYSANEYEMLLKKQKHRLGSGSESGRNCCQCWLYRFGRCSRSSPRRDRRIYHRQETEKDLKINTAIPYFHDGVMVVPLTSLKP